ncbi:MAG: hypothetical protein PHO67_07970 [Candidatus Omnitrophica bacterium]|nr:hypothetical protein [Candidatus Omnitrophota bacterium]
MDDRIKLMVLRFQLFLILIIDLSLIGMAFTGREPGPVLAGIAGGLHGVFLLKEDIVKSAASVVRRIRSRKMKVTVKPELCARDSS